MTANFSDQRRQMGVAMIRDKGIVTDPRLSEEARITYAMGILIATDDGFVSDDALLAAAKDPSIRAAAKELLNRAGAQGS